jgi:hypothetical protein
VDEAVGADAVPRTVSVVEAHAMEMPSGQLIEPRIWSALQEDDSGQINRSHEDTSVNFPLKIGGIAVVKSSCYVGGPVGVLAA